MLTTSICLLAALSFMQAAPQIAEKPGSLLDQVVLTQAKSKFTARDILQANKWDNKSLMESLERDPLQAEMFLNSPVFLARTRAFADSRNLDSALIPGVEEPAVSAEASAWAKDRGRDTPAVAVLFNHGLTIENRARLLANQQSRFGTADLRQHMLSSIPEFFGEISVSLVRIPLVDLSTGKVVSSKQRRAVYNTLDQLAQDLGNSKSDWDEAVIAHSPSSDHKKHGYLGIIRRDMTTRFEEPLLRHIFSELGFKMPTKNILRGPVLTETWAYLARIETVRTRGVVDLQRVRSKVERSLREKLLQEKLSALRTAADFTFLLPLK